MALSRLLFPHERKKTQDLVLVKSWLYYDVFIRQLAPSAWYRYGVGITHASGLISKWDDQSGNSRHLVQSTGTNQPALQSDNSILFDGVDNYLKASAFTLNQPETVYLLFKQVSWTASDAICDGEAALSMIVNSITSSPRLSLFAGTANLPVTDGAVVGSYVALAAVFNGASSVIQVNGTTSATGNPGAANAGGFTLGARGNAASFSNIAVKEVIVYPAAHDQATRSKVIEYLMRLGGLL